MCKVSALYLVPKAASIWLRHNCDVHISASRHSSAISEANARVHRRQNVQSFQNAVSGRRILYGSRLVRVSCYTHQEIKTSGKEAIQTWRIQSFRTTFLLNHEISIGSASMATTSPPPLRGADCSNSDPDWKVAKELVNFNHEKNHVFFKHPELYHGILLHVSSSERSEATMLTRHLEPPRSSCPNHLFPWRQRGRYQAALRQSLKLSKRKACT